MEEATQSKRSPVLAVVVVLALAGAAIWVATNPLAGNQQGPGCSADHGFEASEQPGVRITHSRNVIVVMHSESGGLIITTTTDQAETGGVPIAIESYDNLALGDYVVDVLEPNTRDVLQTYPVVVRDRQIAKLRVNCVE
jgi:hypothetical protein